MTPTTEIILGPPGCGKTHSLLEIVDQELQRGTDPARIGFVSFTKRAAEEAISRACEKFKLSRRQFPHFRTLHSLCFHQLGMRRADVLEGSRMRDFARYAGITLSGRNPEDGNILALTPGDRAVFIENLARVRRRSLREEYEADDAGIGWREVERVGAALGQFKRERGLSDFTDMLQQFVAGGMRPGLEVLIGDEQQDSSLLQWQVFNQLAKGCRRVAVAGDDDQNLYHWAGADVETFINLPGNARVLGQSYRVPRRIQALAGGVIERVVRRRPKEWAARAEEGVIEHAVDFRDADVSGPDVLVLARNSYVLNEQVEPALRRQGIIFERNGRLSVSLKLLQTITDWEAMRAGHSVTPEAARACLDLCGAWGPSASVAALEGLESVTLADLTRLCGLATNAIWYEALDRIPPVEAEYIRAARSRGERLREKPRVRISTIHSAKGAEAAEVVLMTEMAPRTYMEMEKRPDDERRVWYVAVSRARDKLTLVGSQSPNRYRI